MRGRTRVAAVLVALLVGMVLVPAPARAAYPGGNGKIAFEREGNIWTVNPDGSQVQQLTTIGAVRPSWSPDGRRIAFSHAGDIWTLDANGTDPVRVTTQPTYESNPTWSPDGQYIAFDSLDRPDCPMETEDFYAIYSVRSRPPVGPARLLASCFMYQPEWGTGGWLLYNGYRTDLYTRNLTTGSGGGRLDWSSGVATWAPDARRLAVTSVGDIWTTSPFGQNWRRLTKDRYTPREAQPAWSPDGSSIAFVRHDRGGDALAIWTIRPDGSGERQVVAAASWPDWQPLPRP